MEKSVYSLTQQFSDGSSAAEESGWTAYFDDPSGDLNSFATSSLLSDAASHHPASKFFADAEPPPAALDHLMIPRKLTLKPKAQFFVDIALEDTASSPDNSPKVADLERLDGNNSGRKSYLGNGRRKGEKYRRDDDDDERNLKKSFEMKPTTEYTDLTKRGLCLVPLSMLPNYNYNYNYMG